MALYKDASGQLVIAASLPEGGSAVAGAASGALADMAPWLRALDAPADGGWHPAGYYAGGGEANDYIDGYLTPSAVVVAADQAGVVGSFANAAGQFRVFLGAAEITGQCAFSVGEVLGVAITIDAAGAYALTALNADSGYAELMASYKGQTLPQVLTVAKARCGLDGAAGADGAAGVNAHAVTLTATAGAFTYTSAGSAPTPASATITATAVNAVGTVYYQFFKNDVSVQNTTANTYSYTPPASFAAMPEKIEVQIREGAATGPVLARDMLMLAGLRTGAHAITIALSNEAHVLPTTSAGVVTYTGSGTTIRVWEGATALVEDSTAPYAAGSFRVAVAASNITAGAVSGQGTTTLTVAQHSAMTADIAQVTFTITVVNSAGVETTFSRVQSLAKSKQGDIGATGATGSAGATGATGAQVFKIYYLAANSASPPATPAATSNGATPAGWSSTPYASLTGTQAQFECDGSQPAGSTTTTWKAPYLSYFKVANLQAIVANTGALTVDNVLSMGTGAVLKSGQTAFDTGTGYWLDYNGGTPRFSVGNASNGIRWDGGTFTVRGNAIIGTAHLASAAANAKASASLGSSVIIATTLTSVLSATINLTDVQTLIAIGGITWSTTNLAYFPVITWTFNAGNYSAGASPKASATSTNMSYVSQFVWAVNGAYSGNYTIQLQALSAGGGTTTAASGSTTITLIGIKR